MGAPVGPAPGRSSTAMVVVEMQNDLVDPSRADLPGLLGALARAVRAREVIPRLARVLEACRSAEPPVPVIHATRERNPGLPVPPLPLYRTVGDHAFLVAGTWGAAVVDELGPAPRDIVLSRTTSLDPSHGSGLWSVLRALGAATLIVAGVSTTLAVEGTVRGAANRGFRTIVIEDCCASVPHDWHRFSVENVLPLIADVTTADEVVRSLRIAPG